MKLFLTSFLVLPSAVIAIAVTMPAQTNAAIDGVHRLDGWTPVPTEKPVAHFGLMRRQAASGGTVIAYAAQDNTCGYVQGKLGAIKTCDVGQTCAALKNPDPSKVATMACCGAGSCQFFGNCIDSREFFATSTACDHGCQQDVNTIKCTASSKPFCFVYTVPGLSAGFYSCDSSTGIDTLFTTFFGQTGALPWTNVYKETSTGISTTTPSVSPGPTTSTTSVTTIPPPTPGPSGDSVPIGAIVGGALGGLAFIALVIGAVVFLCLYHRKKERGQATATQDLNRPYSNQVPIAVSDVKHYSGAPNGPYPYGIMVGKDGPI